MVLNFTWGMSANGGGSIGLRKGSYIARMRGHKTFTAPIRGKITKNFLIAKYKYQQICTKCMFFTLRECKKRYFIAPKAFIASPLKTGLKCRKSART